MRDDATCVMRSQRTTSQVYEPTQVVLGPRPALGATSTSGCLPRKPTLSELARPLMLAAQQLSEPGFECVSLATLRTQLTRQQQHFEQACQRHTIDRYTTRLAQRVLRCWLQQAGEASQLARQVDGGKFVSSLTMGECEHAELLAALELLLLQPQRCPEWLMLVRDCLNAGFSLAKLAPNGVADAQWQARLAAALAPPILALTAIADSTAPSASPNPDQNAAILPNTPGSRSLWYGLLLLIACAVIAMTCGQAWHFQQQSDDHLAGWFASGEQLTRSPQAFLMHYQDLKQWQLRQQEAAPWLSGGWLVRGQWERRVAKALDDWSRAQLMPVVAAALVNQWSALGVDEVTAWRMSVDYRALSGQLPIESELVLAGLSRLLADERVPPSDWQNWLSDYWANPHWPQLSATDWQPLTVPLREMSTTALVLALLETLAATTVKRDAALPSPWLDTQRRRIEALYTRAGFSQVYWPWRERWLQYVVGAWRDSDEVDLDTQIALLDAAYWRNYHSHWQDLPERLRWQSARDLAEWLTQLDTWRDASGMLAQWDRWEAAQRVLGESADQTEQPALMSGQVWAQSVSAAAVSLAVAVQTLLSAPDPDQAALAWLRAELESDAHSLQPATPFTYLHELSGTGPSPAATWLHDWLAQGWRLLVSRAGSAIAKQYQQDVYAFYRERIASCFPYQRNAQNDCVPADVQAFFEAGGLLDRFQQDVIKPLQSSGRFSSLLPSPLAATLQLPVWSPATEQVLDRWREQWAADQGVGQVRLMPQRLDAAVRRVLVRQGTRSYPFQHGLYDPAWLSWSLQGVTEPVVVQFQDYFGKASERRFSGAWAVLRVFDRFPPRKQGTFGGYWRVTAGDHEATYRVGAETIAWYRAWQGLAEVVMPTPAAWQATACQACQSESP